MRFIRFGQCLSSRVNAKIAEKLGLKNTRILAPKKEMKKLTAYLQPNYSEQVRNAVHAAGAGSINGLKTIVILPLELVIKLVLVLPK